MENHVKLFVTSLIFLLIGIFLMVVAGKLSSDSATLGLAVTADILKYIAFILSVIALCTGVAVKVIDLTRK